MRLRTFKRLHLPIHSVRDLPAKPRSGRRRTGHEGQGLELLILSSQTTVRLTKIPLSARRLAGGGIMAVSGPVDFMGGHKPTGALIVFDAKQTQKTTRLATGKKELREHQRQEICAYGEDGFIAGLLCECTTTRRLYWCDWRKISQRRPSVPWSDMTDIGPSTHAIQWNQVIKASMYAELRVTEGKKCHGEETDSGPQAAPVLAMARCGDASGEATAGGEAAPEDPGTLRQTPAPGDRASSKN